MSVNTDAENTFDIAVVAYKASMLGANQMNSGCRKHARAVWNSYSKIRYDKMSIEMRDNMRSTFGDDVNVVYSSYDSVTKVFKEVLYRDDNVDDAVSRAVKIVGMVCDEFIVDTRYMMRKGKCNACCIRMCCIGTSVLMYDSQHIVIKDI